MCFSLLEAGLSAAAILVSLGAVLGRVNPFQTLLLAVAEAAVFVLNSHVGYNVMGVIDVGA